MPAHIPHTQKTNQAAQLPAPTARAVVRVPLALLPEYLRFHKLQVTGIKHDMLVTRPAPVTPPTLETLS